MERPKVLLVDGKKKDAVLIQKLIAEGSADRLSTIHVDSIAEALKVSKLNPNVVITSLDLCDRSGLSAYQAIQAEYSDCPIILLDEKLDRTPMIDALREGAQGYLLKGSFNSETLVQYIDCVIEKKNSKNFTKERALGHLRFLKETIRGVAHEMNTVLNVILLSSQILKSNIKKIEFEKSDSLMKRLDSTENMGRRMAKIAKFLQSVARTLSDTVFEEVKFSDVFYRVVSLSQEKFDQSDIELSFDLGEEEVFLHCRESDISQLILNLISDSREAVLEGDERWVKVSIVDLEENFEIVVRDSRKKISEDLLKGNINPFHLYKDDYSGTRLGLSISKLIAELHGGTLTVGSDIEEPRFRVRLPKNQF